MAAARSGDLVEASHHLVTTTKVNDEETTDSNVKRENEENESGNDKLRSDSSPPQVCTSILTSPRLNGPDQSFKMLSESSRSIFKSPSVLRPSQLNGTVGNSLSPQKPAFLLNPSRLNPFTKIPIDESGSGGSKDEQKSDCNSNAPKFLPLLQNGSKSEANNVAAIAPAAAPVTLPASATSRSNDFVFGQNIQARVVSDNKSEDAKSADCTNANGTSDMLFSSALKESPIPDGTCSARPTQGTKSLSESAREYEESRAVKRKYEEVEVKTGEEGETNVLQITCKLFAFDKTGGGTWQERGRGTLRLNDQGGDDSENNSHSRLVFRTSGSLRVVLNTKIWAEMAIQRASDKSIRLTAFDSNGEVKVFLLTGTPEDVKQLQKHLEVRVAKETENQNKSSNVSSLTCQIVGRLECDSKKLAGGEQSTSTTTSN